MVSLKLLTATLASPCGNVCFVIVNTAQALGKFIPCLLCLDLKHCEWRRVSSESCTIKILWFVYLNRYHITNHCIDCLIKPRAVHEAKVCVLEVMPVAFGHHCHTKSR